jgi:hypothetical protein
MMDLGALHVIFQMQKLRKFQSLTIAKAKSGEDVSFEAHKSYLICKDILNDIVGNPEWRNALQVTFGAIVVNNFVKEIKEMANDMENFWQPNSKKEVEIYLNKIIA